MPRQPPPPQKRGRKKAHAEMASSVTQEVIAVVRKGSHITKKRVIEKIDIKSRASPFSLPDDDLLDALSSQMEPSQSSNKQNTSKQLPSGGASCSVSVSVSPCLPRQHSFILFRPKSRSGFQTKSSGSLHFFVKKHVLKKNPALRVNQLGYIVVSVVFQKSRYARTA